MTMRASAGRLRRAAGLLLTLVCMAAGGAAGSVLPVTAAGGQAAQPSAPDMAVAAGGTVRAGAAKVDATWRVGASAGQYAGKGPGMVDMHGQTIEPHGLSTTQHPSHGIHSRDWVRALVLEGANGGRMAVVTNDLYIPQDLINRRVAAIVADHDRRVALGLVPGPATGITSENLTISISHNHTSPYYSAMAWGAWAFQDVFDIRFFEHYADAMARAVIAAATDLRPARVGGGATAYTKGKRHSYGPTVGDDGLPAGYPMTDHDPDLSVIAVDDVSDPADPTPLATWAVYGLHPEHLKTPQLLTTEYIGALHRFVERETGGISLFSQKDTGTAEPAREALAHTPEERQEFSGRHFAQMERQGRQLADAVTATRADITAVSAGGTAATAHTVVPFADDVPVGVRDLRFAPPGARVSPTVSSCRTERAAQGNPGVPVVGLPDCQFPFGSATAPVVGGARSLGLDPAVTYRTLREAGVPVPDNTGVPSYVALQETVQVHLQAIRIGEIGLTICPCEQFADQSRTITSRLDRVPGNLWYGFDWTANPSHPGWEPGVIYDGATGPDGELLPGHGPAALGGCSQNADTTWTCRNPQRDQRHWTDDPSRPEVLPPVPDEAFRRMKAQIYNDARGWDDPANSAAAEAEPIDPAAIWGNVTHEELHGAMDGGGYAMVVPVGMSNDYLGYIPTYREFQRGDHYRKALAGLGPHSSDFLATRLTRMAAELKGGPAVQRGPKDLAYDVDGEHQVARAEALGAIARTHLPAYEAQLPPDGGTPALTAQPTDVARFGAARVAWTGGSNYTDSPEAVVERCVRPEGDCDQDDPAQWERFADGAGDVQVKVHFPTPQQLPAYRAGQHVWRWEATWEAMVSDVPLPDASGVVHLATPTGTYRFAVSGCHRGATPMAGQAGACSSWDATERVTRYELVSEPFRVGPWEGITATSLTVVGASDDAVAVGFAVGPAYPLPAPASNTREADVDYPDTYASPFAYINASREVRDYGHPARAQAFCLKCSFRPWADSGAIASAAVTWTDASGASGVALARRSGERWVADVPAAAVSVVVAAGQVRDAHGNRNGAASEVLSLRP